MIRRCGIAVVGGGISGLAAAYYLRRRDPGLSIAVLEASRYWGGKIITERQHGRVIEWGPDSFLTSKPDALELVQDLGLSDQLLSSTGDHGRTLILRGGKLIPIPEQFFLLAPMALLPFWKSPLFSLSGKVNIVRERFRRSGTDEEDESIGSFVRRRFGEEALHRVGGPLLGGIYMGDPDRLSIRSTFPQLVEMERAHGSVTAGLLRRRPAAAGGRSLFVSFRDGMETLPRALLGRLDAALCPETPVQKIERQGGSYRLFTGGDGILADRVLIATDPETAGTLLEPCRSIPELKEFTTVSSVVLNLVFGDGVSLPDAYGVLVPRPEGKQISAISFPSKKFQGRVPSGESMLRIFLGGYDREEILAKQDDALLKLVSAELCEILGITAAPRFARIIRWRRANPQYPVGHGRRMGKVRQALDSLPGLELLGSAYDGVGIPDCVRQAKRAAEAILK